MTEIYAIGRFHFSCNNSVCSIVSFINFRRARSHR